MALTKGISTTAPSRGAADAGGGPSPVMTLMVITATLGIIAYTSFLLAPAHRGDLLPYAMVITAESILVFHALLSMWTILSSTRDPRDFAYHDASTRLTDASGRLQLAGRAVEVDVLITVYGEDIETVRRTVLAALAIKGRHRTWVLDDGRSDEVRDMAEQYGARYVRRLSSHGAKAGNINHALTLAKGDFFVILDADFVASPRFIEETLPFFIDDEVAFVQTPQAYGNLHTVIARGAAYMQSVFYRFVQPGRNRFNAALCVGTNVIFRRAAIDDVGGMYTGSKSEDVWTTLHLHERGWRSIYIPDVLAVGDAPETVEAYSKQQLRWATGGFEILLRHSPLSPRRRLTMDQRLQYLVTATFYLTGICPLLLLLVPPLEIYFDLRPMTMELTVWTWALYYAGFYVMQILLAWFAIGSFKWETLTLATVSFPIYTKALVNVLTGKDEGWHVTGSSSRRSPFNYIVPQTLFFAFLALTTLVAIWRDTQNANLTLATAWNATNTLILGAFLAAALREAHLQRHPRRVQTAPGPRRASAPPRTIVVRPAGLPVPVAQPALARTAVPATAAPASTPVIAPVSSAAVAPEAARVTPPARASAETPRIPAPTPAPALTRAAARRAASAAPASPPSPAAGGPPTRAAARRAREGMPVLVGGGAQ
jgi:cellulose synthase (UDP-forming)